jgi:RHS repeat-associated protein
MTYTGPGQSRRTVVGGTSQVNSVLGVSADTTGSNTTYYTREPDGTLTEERLPGGNYYYIYDGIGSVVALTDSNGNVVDTYKYEPYGALSASTGTVPNPWRFAGYYFDSATGLYKVGERYYGTGTGRWLQRDSIDSPLDSSGWNRFLYAADDPVNATDPAGTYWFLLYSPKVFLQSENQADPFHSFPRSLDQILINFVIRNHRRWPRLYIRLGKYIQYDRPGWMIIGGKKYYGCFQIGGHKILAGLGFWVTHRFFDPRYPQC